MNGLIYRLFTLLIVPLTLGMSFYTIWDLWGRDHFPKNINPVSEKRSLCIGTVNPTVRISRATLAWLITVPVGSAQREVMGQLGAPYCLFSDVDGFIRVAYPCEWDPSTWILIVFQKQQYAGYDFNFINGSVEQSD